MMELNTTDNVIDFIEGITGIKLSRWQKFWIKVEHWADFRLNKIFRNR